MIKMKKVVCGICKKEVRDTIGAKKMHRKRNDAMCFKEEIRGRGRPTTTAQEKKRKRSVVERGRRWRRRWPKRAIKVAYWAWRRLFEASDSEKASFWRENRRVMANIASKPPEKPSKTLLMLVSMA